MTDVLGYQRFGAQGGDWGGFVSSVLGHRYPERLTGIHLNLLAVRRDPKMIESPTPEEKVFLDQLAHFLKEETGYQWIQGTRPQTLAFGLANSPAGLAAWIVEKFRAWTDCGGNPENAVSRDEMLANISLYWFTGCIGASFWPYYARMHGPWPIPDGTTVDVPMGYTEFPKEILRPPTVARGQDLHRHPPLERDAEGRALRSPRAARRARARGRGVLPRAALTPRPPPIAGSHYQESASANLSVSPMFNVTIAIYLGWQSRPTWPGSNPSNGESS